MLTGQRIYSLKRYLKRNMSKGIRQLLNHQKINKKYPIFQNFLISVLSE
jgi:hypothetical protein